MGFNGSMSKGFKIRERYTLTLRADADQPLEHATVGLQHDQRYPGHQHEHQFDVIRPHHFGGRKPDGHRLRSDRFLGRNLSNAARLPSRMTGRTSTVVLYPPQKGLAR